MSLRAAASLRGRMRRRDWWLVQLLATALTVTVSSAMMTVAPDLYERMAFAEVSVAICVELTVAAFLQGPLLISNVRRAHDKGRSGWFPAAIQVASFVLTLVAFPIIGEPPAEGGPVAVISMAGLMFCGFYLLIGLGVPDGTPGPNRYGPSPKSGTAGRNGQRR